jgi:hypothetical protein
MTEFLIANAIGTLLIFLTSFAVYEILAVLWHYLPRLPIGRLRVAIVMGAIFPTLILGIWLYGIAYYWLDDKGIIGSFAGSHTANGDLLTHIYYSAVIYTSLGLGDIIPTGGMRFLTGVEVLNGLVLIGWTVSYAFLAMQRFWKFRD